jgi:hypothetical protein
VASVPASHAEVTPLGGVFSPSSGAVVAGYRNCMGVLRGLGRLVGGLLAGVGGLLRGVVEGLGRLLRRVF